MARRGLVNPTIMTAGLVVGLGALTSMAVPTGVAQSQTARCLHDAAESGDQRVRRRAAIQYLRDMNVAETRLHQQRGTYTALADAEAAAVTTAPFGFVPRLTFDRWGYAIILKDVLDPCVFSLFADQDNAIYAGQPVDNEEFAESGGSDSRIP